MEQLFTNLSHAVEGAPLLALGASAVWGIQGGADAPDTGGVSGIRAGRCVNHPQWGRRGDLSANGSGIVAASLALFVFVMEKIVAKGLGQDVSKLAEQKRRLLLPGFLALLPGPKENQDGQVKD
jgi:hypothetical protein